MIDSILEKRGHMVTSVDGKSLSEVRSENLQYATTDKNESTQIFGISKSDLSAHQIALNI